MFHNLSDFDNVGVYVDERLPCSMRSTPEILETVDIFWVVCNKDGEAEALVHYDPLRTDSALKALCSPMLFDSIHAYRRAMGV